MSRCILAVADLNTVMKDLRSAAFQPGTLTLA